VCEGAWYAKTYLDAFGIAEGQHLMVLGAPGAIAVAALQMANACGAKVTAVVDGASKLELVTSDGADRVIDPASEDYTRAEGFHDFFFDAVGEADLAQASAVLKPKGVYTASDLGTGGQYLWLLHRPPVLRKRRVIPPLPKGSRAAVAAIAELLAQGSLRAVIDRVVPLDEIVEAYRSGKKTGIVVVDVTAAGGVKDRAAPGIEEGRTA
jgi:NADPH:quinone reductase-like Zn-dependent oxidoreductase